MSCPHHNRETGDESDGTERKENGDRGLDERSFMRATLTVGGASALSTAVGLYGLSGTATADTAGDVSIAERNNRQHAWDAYELYDEDRETSLPPESQLLLNTDYDEGSGVPSAEENGHTEPESATDAEDDGVVELLDAVRAAVWSDDDDAVQGSASPVASGSLRQVLNALAAGRGSDCPATRPERRERERQVRLGSRAERHRRHHVRRGTGGCGCGGRLRRRVRVILPAVTTVRYSALRGRRNSSQTYSQQYQLLTRQQATLVLAATRTCTRSTKTMRSTACSRPNGGLACVRQYQQTTGDRALSAVVPRLPRAGSTSRLPPRPRRGRVSSRPCARGRGWAPRGRRTPARPDA